MKGQCAGGGAWRGPGASFPAPWAVLGLAGTTHVRRRPPGKPVRDPGCQAAHWSGSCRRLRLAPPRAPDARQGGRLPYSASRIVMLLHKQSRFRQGAETLCPLWSPVPRAGWGPPGLLGATPGRRALCPPLGHSGCGALCACSLPLPSVPKPGPGVGSSDKLRPGSLRATCFTPRLVAGVKRTSWQVCHPRR